MATSKKTVKSVTLLLNQEKKPDLDQYGNYASKIIFTDNTSGVYAHKELENGLFFPGKESEFEAENKGTYYRLRKVKTAYSPGGGKAGWVPRSKAEVKHDSVSYSAGVVKDLVVAGKIKVEEFSEYLAKVQLAVNSEIDKIT